MSIDPIGSSFDDFLKEEDLFDEVEKIVSERVRENRVEEDELEIVAKEVLDE